MTDLHALIHRMADRLDHYCQLMADNRWELDPLANEARAALADGPAVPEGREPASIEDSLALRVQRLEAMRETEKAALLDAFRQIDDLKHRIDFHYWKIHQLEEATNTNAAKTDD